MFLVDVDRELVAKVALAMLLSPGRVRALLPPLRGLPIRRRGRLIFCFGAGTSVASII